MATWGELEKAGTKWSNLEGMTWGELEEFCTVNPKTKQIPDDMEVSFVPMQSVSDTGDVQTDEVRKASEVKKGFTFFEEGDVLFAKITPCMENGKGGIARGLKNGVGFGSTEFHVLHPDPEKVSSEWLYYLTSWDEFRKQCSRNMTGSAGQKRVPKSYLAHYKVHLPALEEQRRIAALLDKVSDLIAKRQAQLDKLDLLVKSRFVEMFGDPEGNNLGVSLKPMTEICTIIDGDRGKNYPAQDEFTPNGYCLFLNAKNVTTNGFSFENCMFITKEKDELLRKGHLDRGDIILTTRGTIGNLAFYDDSVPYENVRINSGMVILRMNHDLVSERFFIEQFKILLSSIKEKIASGSAQPQLPISTMNKIMMLIPAIEQQKEFSRFIEQIEKSKLTIQQSLDKLETLKKALMQQYFG